MNAKGKLRIMFNEENADGCFSEENRVVLADAVLQVIQHANFSILELHMVMSTGDVQEMLSGMQRAGVEVVMDRMLPAGDPN